MASSEFNLHDTNRGTVSQTDFNDIMEAGTYWITTSTTPQHAPETGNGVLEVIPFFNAQPLQRYTNYNASGPTKIYVRMYVNNAWGPWKSVSLT